MRKRRIVTYLLVLMILSLSVVQAYAGKIDNLKKDQKNINKKISDTKNQIKTLEKKSEDVSKQIKDLDIKVDDATTDLEIVEVELVNLGHDIDRTTLELEEAEEALAERKETFNQRLRVMYMNGNVGYLELLLTSENVKDFLNRKDMIQSITDHDTELIKFMKEQKDIVDNKKNELQGQRASIEVTKSKLESRRNDLIKATREKEDLMSELAMDIKAAEIAYDKANQEYKDLGARILKMQQETGPYSGGTMMWPVPASGRITSYYGYRIHPIFKSKKLHTGLDIGVPTGSSIVAASDGKVIHSDWLGSYGKAVLLDHGGGIVTLYAHNSALTVKVGQYVKRGNTIAKAGSTGNSTGPHLHFEVRKNGAYVDPLPWVKGK